MGRSSTGSPRRVLFFAEAVTLAHVARPASLAAALDPSRYEAWIACRPKYFRFLPVPDARRLALASVDEATFGARLRAGRPVYTADELAAYLREDLALIEQVAPDVVVGDFRLSLSASARLTGGRLGVDSVPYAALANAYWSPYAADRSLPLPVLPWTRWVPLAAAQRAFDLIQTRVLAPHCRPLNELRAAHGLAVLPQDLRRVYTDADLTLYADDPALFPLRDAPRHHRHIGPVVWSPPGALPAWWDEPPADRPQVYVTMGSSGSAALLELVLDALAALPVSVLASTAGRPPPGPRSRNAWLAEYLPGEAAAARSRLVICNGGSPTSQQALACGVPVVGVCSNMDQMLNMRAIARAGKGIALRADRISRGAVADAATRCLDRPRADQLPAGPAMADTARAFVASLDELTGTTPAVPH